MGGLVACRYLDLYRNKIPHDKLGRVVMLAPPNGGSDIADLVHKLPPYKWFYGRAGQSLTTKSQAQNKSEIYYDLGIIAGNKAGLYFIANLAISGENDGRVSVKQTKLKGMKDHIVVNETHTFIMNKPKVHKKIISFFEHGNFL